MISQIAINADYILIAFASLLGATLGFLLRPLFEVKPQVPENAQTNNNATSLTIFKNSAMIAVLWPEDDDGDIYSKNHTIFGDEKCKSQILQILNCDETSLIEDLCLDDAKLFELIISLRKDGKDFQWQSKSIEVSGFTFGANACVMLRVAPANYGARGTDGLDIPIWKTNNKGELTWGNNAFVRAIEVDDLDEALLQNARFDAKSQIEAVAAAKGQTFVDTRAVSIDGQRRMMRIYTAPAFDGAIGMAVDISDEIAAQDILKREAKAHVETLNHLNDAVVVFDQQKHLQTYNSAFAKLWSLEQSWLDEHPTNEELLDKLRAKSWLPLQRNYIEWRNSQIAYYKSTSAIPDETWTLPSGRILRVMRQRQPTGGLLILFEDISDKTSLQAQFKTQIEVSRATLDRLQEGVAVFSSSGRLTLANAAFHKIWNLDEDFVKPHPEFGEFSRIGNNNYPDEEFWGDLFARICDPTPSGRRETSGNIHLRNQTMLHWLTRPLPDGATMVAFNDVTAQNRIASLLREKALALAEADKLKTAFLEKVSYQLRTPLTTITGYSDILLAGIGGELSPLQQEYLKSVHEAGDQLGKMVADLLDLATIDAGHAPLDLGDVNISQVLTQAVEIAQSKLSHSQIQIEIEEDCGGIIRGDDKKIRQIMFNLLHNAMRNIEKDDQIKIGSRRIQNTLRLYVTAPNHNLDPQSAPLEFDAFTEGSRHGGLGLVLVKKFVELHGGWIAMGAKTNDTLTITCHLPINAKPSSNNPELELV
jgi:signal transduction histidine kinase